MKELEHFLLNQDCDIAVPMKDTPAELHEDLEIMAILEEDPRDVLISKYSSLNDLKLILGTSSVRRIVI